MNAKRNKPHASLIRPRVYIGDGIAIGPGKIDLLRAVGETRSIAAAARSLGLPYKRAWLLIDSLNEGFGQPVIETATGGKGGGGASLTTLGQQLIERYDALETSLNAGAGKELQALRDLAN
ncbi:MULTISPECIES: winged helix-turn-helix domain-containing protein [Marinobacter]|jgi:molybdate transport system regulatory protein|uniref:winged helix-turn-helix domain-containing protein n=1 Tax=Marinobacter TaxID=2742 RepID=UPI002591C5B2|nr:LysR family transcriptional regulator [Marinobacter sp. UBA5687]|tara:strand:- start:70 stop:432 length:363 start_codon:yes stop_codon:yes gene_type:complete